MNGHAALRIGITIGFAAAAAVVVAGGPAGAAPGDQGAPAAPAAAEASIDEVAAHWTAARRAAATPRDLVVDARGLGYLRRADGSLVPHGHGVAAQPIASVRPVDGPAPAAKPTNPGGGGGGSTDTTGPTVTNMSPVDGATIGATATFSATVTDPSGVKSVSFVITDPDDNSSTFAATAGANGTWSVGLQGFTDGEWSWRVVAKDKVGRGNTTTSPTLGFTVDTGSGGGGTGEIVTNAAWTTDDQIRSAVGRIYFEMPANSRQTRWNGYVCSGTVVTDSRTGDSLILTAAHCVYDDVYKVFARNVLFIPDQASTTGTGTDRDCSNDRYGCWAPNLGVVHPSWTTATFPDNIPWDYAYYVVPTSGAHQAGTTPGVSDSLESAVAPMTIDFTTPAVDTTGSDDVTRAIGYSYSEDPQLMYCAEDMTTEGADNWWLPNCGLSGGSSGGSWVQPMTNGGGPIISVNSWGYSNQPGMAGPKLDSASAQCVYTAADALAGASVDRGIISNCS